jgi:hypothetical protein
VNLAEACSGTWGRMVESKVFEIIVRHHRARSAVMTMDIVGSAMMKWTQSSRSGIWSPQCCDSKSKSTV